MSNGNLNKWAIHIVAAAIVLASQTKPAHSAPLQNDSQLNGSSISVRPSTPSIAVGISDHISSDYISSDEEFQQLLERLQQETRDSVALNPDNYVSEDVELDEIIWMIGNHSQTIQGSLTGGEVNQSVGLGDAPIQRSNSQPIEQSIGSSTTTEGNNLDCAICLEPLRLNNLHTLHCSHKFHLECLRNWYEASFPASCPLCRYPIISEDLWPRH